MDMALRQAWRWLTGSGGLIVLVCFFLPLLTVSCAGQPILSLTAYDMAQGSDLGVNEAAATLGTDSTALPPELDSITKNPTFWLVLAGALLGILTILTPSAHQKIAGGAALLAAIVTLIPLVLAYTDSQDLRNPDALDALSAAFEIAWGPGLYGIILGAIVMTAGGLVAILKRDIAVAPPMTVFPPADLPSMGPVVGPTVSAFTSSTATVRPAPMPPVEATQLAHQARGAKAWLVNRSGEQHQLQKDTVMGRDATKGAQIILDDQKVSGLHARIRYENRQFVLYDLASRNGTFWNGNRVGSPRALKDGDRVRVGQNEFTFKEVQSR